MRVDNDQVLTAGGIRSFDNLFAQNNLFTYAVTYKLIADSSHKFSFNLNDVKDPSKGFGIVRKNVFKETEQLLDAFLSNDLVLSPGNIKSFDEIKNLNPIFSRTVIEKLIADSSRKYTLNILSIDGSQSFGIVRKK